MHRSFSINMFGLHCTAGCMSLWDPATSSGVGGTPNYAAWAAILQTEVRDRSIARGEWCSLSLGRCSFVEAVTDVARWVACDAM